MTQEQYAVDLMRHRIQKKLLIQVLALTIYCLNMIHGFINTRQLRMELERYSIFFKQFPYQRNNRQLFYRPE